jgi:hypothetical protein
MLKKEFTFYYLQQAVHFPSVVRMLWALVIEQKSAKCQWNVTSEV